MTAEKYLTYRGDIKGAVGVGRMLAFVTAHPEGQATALYRLDADTLALDADPMPRGGTAIAAIGETLFVAGGDAQIYRASIASGEPSPLTTAFDAPATALAPLAEGQLAALVGARAIILATRDGKTVQSLDLPEPGSCLASDPTGRWLAVGTTKGTVLVFEREEKPEFLLSDSARLHEGAVTAILFEPDELRFLSAGADNKLLTTHARGKLEPEDKGRANTHADIVAGLIWGPSDRLYSGSRDGTIKSWPRVGAIKPATIKDGVGRVVALAMVHIHERPRLVAACDDSTIRIFPVDAAGKIGETSHRVYDAHARARNELSQDDPTRREEALKALAGYADVQALDIVAQRADSDPDSALRLLASDLLGASRHARAATLLEKLLGSADEAVRVSAFQGLRKKRGESDLGPIDLALKTEKPDIGRLAVQALETLASRDDQALARLVGALNAKTPEVRLAAVVGLESAHDPRSPESNLSALASTYADVRRAALVRLYRRGLLAEPAVQSALRRRTEDSDPEVRRTAFLLALHTRERLLEVLLARDPELERQLKELEAVAIGSASESPASGVKAIAEKFKGWLGSKPGPGGESPGKKAKSGKSAAPHGLGLDDTDFEPLLQATASRALDTSLRGARGLAILGDHRAFGLLLQLSREEDKAARAEVCRAMAALGEPRSVERLRSMLHDPEAEVRDAAFTAMIRLHEADPLFAAESGLNASHEDIRRRALQALVDRLRKMQSGGTSEPAVAMLARTLNDSFPAIRSEAFKSVLGLSVGGAGAGALRFAARSVHADVRREVLTEVMAQIAEPWGWDLLLKFFNDPDKTLRVEAFEFALKKNKGLELLEAALASRHPDLRKRSVDELIKKHTAGAQAILARAIDDEDRDVRLAAIESLVDADSLALLAGALANPHPDIRLRAAKALARHGDGRALGPLLAMATAPEPAEQERRDDWLKLAESALDGLGELGDPSALTHLIPLLDSPHPPIRQQAARALAWVSRPGATDALRHALQHSDPAVKYQAAKGLAYAGDASVAPLIFSEAGGKVVSIGEQLAAALALGAAGEVRLAVYLDSTREEVRSRALILMMMREWKDPDGNASRCLACLASRTPQIRLTAVRALEVFFGSEIEKSRPKADFVAALINDRGDKPEWKITAATVDGFAEMLVHGDPRLRARTARLFARLGADEKEQAAFDQAWSLHQARHAAELAELTRQAGARRPVPSRYTREQIRQLAFGAYVGLVRDQRGAPTKGKAAATASDPSVSRVRQTALGRLLTMADSDSHLAAAARPVFMQALGDPNQAVRFQAFDQARAVGIGDSELAAEALASGHVDLGVKGLELLSGEGDDAGGAATLERAMLSRTDDLAIEAGKLLIRRQGPVTVAARALEAVHPPLRSLAVTWLAAEYDKTPAAGDELRSGLSSRYQAIREATAFELASRKDPAAFEPLVAILNGATARGQQRAISAMEVLGDPRAGDAFLDRIENDPAGTAPVDELLKAVGRSRRPEAVDRLLALWEKDAKRREAIFNATLAISGYDQRIEYPEDDQPTDRWREKQFPRHDEVLARLMDRVSAPADAKSLARLIPGARWAQGKAVDPVLAGLINHPNDEVRQKAVEAIDWRVRKRKGKAEPLRKALGHRDAITQFLAAEGLARAGRGDGLNVLLASIDFATDLDIRRRAISALGELADERALDVLLKLAGEDGNALQEPALVAIGHFGRSARSDEVFKVLGRYARLDTGVGWHALNGLRWLGTRAAWQIIRECVADLGRGLRANAIELLGHDNDPATRDLLLRILSGDHPNVAQWAIQVARRVFGPDSLEPDYAILQNNFVARSNEARELLGRVLDRGEPRRIFEILPRCTDEVHQSLANALSNRPEPPVGEALAALESPDPDTAGVAARVLGRAGAKAVGAGPPMSKALAKWRKTWEEARPNYVRSVRGNMEWKIQGLDRLTTCVRDLIWASGRLGVATEALAEAATGRPDDAEYRPIRLEAVLALAASEPSPAVAAALEAAALAGAPDVRAPAAQAIARRDPARAAGMARRLLSDRVGFHRLTLDDRVKVEETLRSAARQVHYQGVVLGDLIDGGDVAALAAVAEDRSLPEAARLGAVEGLAAMAREPAEEVLRRVGLRTDEDEEFRKAVWRGLRRSKRARQKAAAPRKEKAEVRS